MREATRSSRASIRLGLAGALALAAGPGCSLVFGLDELQSGAAGPGGATSSSSTSTASASTGATSSASGASSAQSTSTTGTASASSSSGGAMDPYADAVLADGPVLYLRLAETSATGVFDEVSQSVVGAYAAAGVTFGTQGIPGASSSAVTFSGGRALVSDASSLDFVGLVACSLEVWINATPDAMPMDYYGRILAKEEYNGGTNRQGYNVLYERSNFNPNGSLITERWNVGGAGANVAPFKMKEGAWHHVVSTFDGTALRLYLDGALVAQNGTLVALMNLGDPLAIGSLPNTGSPFLGAIDEVAIYDHALTPTAVQTHHMVGAAP